MLIDHNYLVKSPVRPLQVLRVQGKECFGDLQLGGKHHIIFCIRLYISILVELNFPLWKDFNIFPIPN